MIRRLLDRLRARLRGEPSPQELDATRQMHEMMMGRMDSLLEKLRGLDLSPKPGASGGPPDPATVVCHACGNPSVAACTSCGRGSCGEGWHLYRLFFTKRHGTDGDDVGSKFFYVCDATCRAPVCVDCLGLRDGYPFPAEELERHAFACPRCGGRVSVLRVDHAGGWIAAEELPRYLQASAPVPGGVVVPYDAYDRVRQVPPGTLVFITFGPRPRPLRPGEGWETLVRLTNGGETATLVLQRRDHPAVATDLFLRQGDELLPLATPLPDGAVWGSERLGVLLGDAFAARGATLALRGDGVHVARVGESLGVEVVLVGIVGLGDVASEPASVGSGDGDAPDASESDGIGAEDAARREEMAGVLGELTALGIWDYTWIEMPRPGTFGPDAVLALAGSTDLSYYKLVYVVFRGVRYANVPRYFSHPEFALATPAEEAQLRDLVAFGPRSVAVRVTRDFGSSMSGTTYVVADAVEVVRPAEGERVLTQPYVAAIPENEHWLYPEVFTPKPGDPLPPEDDEDGFP